MDSPLTSKDDSRYPCIVLFGNIRITYEKLQLVAHRDNPPTDIISKRIFLIRILEHQLYHFSHVEIYFLFVNVEHISFQTFTRQLQKCQKSKDEKERFVWIYFVEFQWWVLVSVSFQLSTRDCVLPVFVFVGHTCICICMCVYQKGLSPPTFPPIPNFWGSTSLKETTFPPMSSANGFSSSDSS